MRNALAPFTKRQVDYLKRSMHSWFSVAEGGKRGGKNVLQTLAFCLCLETHPSKLHMIAGVSTATARLNIVDCDGFGMQNYFQGRCRRGKYQGRDCLMVDTLSGEKVVLVSGGGKMGDEKLIKGNTYGMAYVTEANECTQAFLQEVFDRTLSSPQRRVFHDLNPKAPRHWYYTDILAFHEERKRMDPSYGFNYGHFTIADNLSVTDEKLKEALDSYDKRSVWYRRDILGERKETAGLIYDGWQEDVNTYDGAYTPKGERFAAIDYGTTNPMVILMIRDDGETVSIDNEYYFDSRREKTQKTDSQYADDLFAFLEGDTDVMVIIDPSAASFIAELQLRGFLVKKADNQVIDGIRMTAALIGQGKLKVNKDRCPNLLGEREGYVWSDKSLTLGEDRPVKENDHAMDAMRYYVKTMVHPGRLVG